VEEPEQIADPKNHDDDYNQIEDRLDGPLHWDETVYKPKQHTHRDECKNDIHKWQRGSFQAIEADGPRGWHFHPQDPAAWLASTWFGLLRLGDCMAGCLRNAVELRIKMSDGLT